MIGALIHLLIYVIVLGLLAWLVFYIVDNIPMPDPFGRVAKVVVVVIFVLILILLLLQMLGGVSLDLPKL